MRELETAAKPPMQTEYTLRAKRNGLLQQSKDGGVPVNEAVQKRLSEIKKQYNLIKYNFEWEK